MADVEIEPATEQQQQGGPKQGKKKAQKREKPDDAVKIGCGGLFRRKKKPAKAKGEKDANGDGEDEAASRAPIEKPKKPAGKSSAKGTVKAEEAPIAGAGQDSAAPDVGEEEAEVAAERVSKQQSAWARPPIVKPQRPPEGPKVPLSKLAAASHGASGPAVPDQPEAEKDHQPPEPQPQPQPQPPSPVLSQPQPPSPVLPQPQPPSPVLPQPQPPSPVMPQPQPKVQPESQSATVTGAVIEDSPQAQMWTNIVSNSMVGTGVFSRAAVCSLATGGVLARSPEDFTPSVEQVTALRDNFDSSRRGVFSGAGFGVADTVYRLQEETGTPEVLCGADADQTEGVLVALSNTAVLIGAYRVKLDQAMELLGELRSNFIGQGM